MRKMLFVILIVAFIVRVYQLNFNSAFIDEAMYVVVGQQILSGDIESGIGAISWVGGFPFMFPVATALFFQIGGIVGSRFLTVILGTLSVFLMYQFTKQLRFFASERLNVLSGIVASSFMAITTIAILTSRMAIYDGLSFTLFFAAVVIFHRALYSGEKKWYLWSSVLFFLSFLSKYIVLIYFPFFLLIPLILAWKHKNRESLMGIIVYFLLPLVLLNGVYIGLNFANLTEFFINQGVVSKASPAEVTRLFGEYTVFGYTLLFAGLLFLGRQQILVILLAAFSLVPLIVHTLTGNDSSIQQHTFLAIIFILPVAGALFARIIQRSKKIGIALLSLVLFVQVSFSITQVQAAENFWPNLDEAAQKIRETITPSDRILSEGGDSMFLELEDKISHDQLDGPFVFEYADKEGTEAYVEAINNKYFTFIELEGDYFSEEDIQAIEAAMKGKYEKIYDNGTIRVFKVQNQ